MYRALTKIISLSVLLTIAIVGVLFYRQYTDSARHVADIENENVELKNVVERLTDERRVAKLLVTDQGTVNGVTHTTLVFDEFARDGHQTLPPKYFTIIGNEAHLDAMVIKFDHDFVKQNDPLRGHSIALFTRIYGNHQSPDSGPVIDAPGHIPAIYQGTDPRVSAFETELWAKFWHLADDPQYRHDMGVRVPNGEGPWWPCAPGKVYTVTLDADGGLNVTSEPMEGIYKDALLKKSGG